MSAKVQIAIVSVVSVLLAWSLFETDPIYSRFSWLAPMYAAQFILVLMVFGGSNWVASWQFAGVFAVLGTNLVSWLLVYWVVRKWRARPAAKR